MTPPEAPRSEVPVRPLAWIFFRYWASVIAAVASVGFVADGIDTADVPQVIAGVLAMMLSALWQWDRNQKAEVDAARRRSEAVREAVRSVKA